MKDNIKNPAQLVFDITKDNNAEDTLITIFKTKLKAGMIPGFNAHKIATDIIVKKAINGMFENNDTIVRINDNTFLPITLNKVVDNTTHKGNIFKRMLNWVKNLFK